MAGGAEGRYRVRVITPDDWQTWRSLRLRALADAPYAFGSRLADWELADESTWRARLELPDSFNVVALLDETPVGMAGGVPGDTASTAQLVSMYVAADARGQGVAELLVEAVAAWAAGRGNATLCLDVRADNGRARRLYQRLGFTFVGEAPRETPEEPLELRMCRGLGAERSRQDAPTRP